MKTLSKISIVLLSLLACSTFSCKKELAPLSQKLKPQSLSSSDSVGKVTTVTYGFQPYGIAVDAALNMYIADLQPSRLLIALPVLTPRRTPIYNPWPYISGSLLSYVDDLTFGPDSAIYFADPVFGVVKRITLSEDVTTVAGDQAADDIEVKDGPVAQARFGFCQRIASCAEGNLYISEAAYMGFPADIRVITPGANGVVYTLYKADKPGSIAPGAVAIHKGIVYFSDNVNTIAKIGLDGTVSTFATGVAAYGLAIDSCGNLYASDGSRHKVFKITPDGVVSTLAGSGATGFSDGTGAGAVFDQPAGLTIHGVYLYVGDIGTSSVRKIVIK